MLTSVARSLRSLHPTIKSRLFSISRPVATKSYAQGMKLLKTLTRDVATIKKNLLARAPAQARPTSPPNIQSVFPVDYQQLAKIQAVMDDLLMKNRTTHYRWTDLSQFLTPATLAPDNSPISTEFRHLARSTSRWILGNMPQFKSITIDGEEILKTPSSSDTPIDLVKIRAVMKPASFGFDGNTISDLNVRNAFEIDGQRIKIQHRPDFFDDIQRMAPKGKKFVPKLYKMHIYEENGFFDMHVDTIHASNHYATLIVSLTSDYEGGEFTLWDGEDGEFVKPDLKTYNHRYHNRYLLFLTDLVHRVQKVKKGERVVLQYDVYIEDVDDYDVLKGGEIKQSKKINKETEDSEETPSEPRTDQKYLYQKYEYKSFFEQSPTKVLGSELDKLTNPKKIVTLVNQYREENPKIEICFLLTQRYPLGMNIKNLKAADRILYDILDPYYELDIGYAINPAILENDEWMEEKYKHHVIQWQNLNVMTYQDIRALGAFLADPTQEIYTERQPDIRLSSKLEPEPKPQRRLEKPLCVVFCGNGAKFKLRPGHVERTGNEGQIGELVYSSVVLSVGPKKTEFPT